MVMRQPAYLPGGQMNLAAGPFVGEVFVDARVVPFQPAPEGLLLLIKGCGCRVVRDGVFADGPIGHDRHPIPLVPRHTH